MATVFQFASGPRTGKTASREFRLEHALFELQRKNEELDRAAKARAEFSNMCTYILLSLCLYTLLTAWMEKVAKLDMTPNGPAALCVSLGTVLVTIPLLLVHIWRHNLKREHVGLRLANWKRSIFEALVVSVAAFPILAACKWLLVLHDPDFLGKPVLNWSYWGPWLPLYALFAPAQEFVARGVQSSIEGFLPMRHRSALAVVLTSVAFGVMHLHYSFRMAMIATSGSIVFGAMFLKQRTLIGVSLAHFILGALISGPFQLMLN